MPPTSEPFVAACAARVPGADVRRADADDLPWPDETLDAALAQLVVDFMGDALTTYADCDELWQLLTLGVGPAGAYCTSLEPRQQRALRDEFFIRLGSPDRPFTLSARAWAVRGVR